MKSLEGSKTLRHLDTSLLQKRVAELQASSQVSIAPLGGVAITKLSIYELRSTRAFIEDLNISVGFQSFNISLLNSTKRKKTKQMNDFYTHKLTQKFLDTMWEDHVLIINIEMQDVWGTFFP